MASSQGVIAILGRGQHDDGGEGIVLAKLAQGSLVRLPIPLSTVTQYSTGVNGTATVTASAANTNPDGMQQVLSFTVPAVTSGAASSAWVERTLWGPRVGVRFRRSNSATLPPFTVWIDGVAYEIRKVQDRRHGSVLPGSTDFEALWLCGDDLGSGPHTVRASVAGDVIGGASRSLIFHGWLADAQFYGNPYRRGSVFSSAPIVLTTGAVTIAPNTPHGLVRKLYLHNTDVSTRVVTLSVGSTNIVKVLSLAASTSAEVDLGEPVSTGILDLRWKADAGAVVNGWVQEVI